MATLQHRPILVLIDPGLGHFRGMIKGIRQNTGPDTWLIPTNPDLRIAEQYAALKPLGVIAQIGSMEMLETLLRLKVPSVNVSSINSTIPGPRVGLDDEAIGRTAARYFLGRGFQHFGFHGYATHGYSNERQRGFAEEITRAGYELRLTPEPVGTASTRGESILHSDREIAAWLKEAPKPLAMFCANDGRGRRLCDVCRHSALRVPEDVAILGVDNDDVLCTVSSPPLSSIAVPSENVGYEAAAMLQKLIRGERVTTPVLLPPMGVVTRQSSDSLAVADTDVSRALRFIRDHAFEDITVENVLHEVPLSRRWLEHKFERVLGRTPAEEIRRLRIERAKELLATTDLSMPEVARRAGFTNAKHLAVSFRSIEDLTPTDYRRKYRQRA